MASGEETPRRRPRRAARRRRRRATCRPRSAPAGSGCARAAGGVTGFATDTAVARRRVRARRAAVRRRADQRPGARSCTSTGRCSTPGPIRRRRGSPTSAGARCASASSTGRAGSWPARRPPRSAGAAPSSSPPRRWAATRGYWWSPDGSAIAACRVDVSPVQTWYISDPANPEVRPTEVRYPAAGTDNATVGLHVLALDGASTEVTWDHEAFPYLADVRWATPSRLLLTVQCRDQRHAAGARSRPAGRRDDRRGEPRRRRLGRARRRLAGRARRRPPRPRRRPRRRPAPRRRRRAGDADRPPGARRVDAVGDDGDVHRQPDRRRHRRPRVAVDAAASRSGSPTTTACTAAAVGGEHRRAALGHARPSRGDDAPSSAARTSPRPPRQPLVTRT